MTAHDGARWRPSLSLCSASPTPRALTRLHLGFQRRVPGTNHLVALNGRT